MHDLWEAGSGSPTQPFSCHCRVVEYKDTGTAIIGGTDEVQALLDDQIVKAQSMRASPYIGPLEHQAQVRKAHVPRVYGVSGR